MKKFLVILFVLISFIANAEYDWVIAHIPYQDNKTTVYCISDNYTGVYNLENPTTVQLKDIGLPSYLWGQFNVSSGVFDTRIIRLQNTNQELILEIEDLRYDLNNKQDNLILSYVVITGLGVILGIVSIMLLYKK